jgi:hypothetical protein
MKEINRYLKIIFIARKIERRIGQERDEAGRTENEVK